MERDYGAEIDGLQKEIAEIKELLQEFIHGNANATKEFSQEFTHGNANATKEFSQEFTHGNTNATKELSQEFVCGNSNAASKGEIEATPAKKQKNAESEDSPTKGKVEIMSNMHPNPKLNQQMEELCEYVNEKECTGMIDYMGVFSSGGRQSNWIRHHVDTDGLLTLIENHTAEKVLNCIGNGDRLNILLAILKKPRTVAELVEVCGLNSTGQVYHHMKPLLTADLIAEEEHYGRGVYIVQPHKVQGIIMLLAGICDIVDESFTKGNWEELEDCARK